MIPFSTRQNMARPNQQISQTMINRIISLKDQQGQLLFDKYSSESILSGIEKNQIDVVQLFSKHLKDGSFNLLQFIRFFANIVPHNPKQNLHLAIGLADLFRQITSKTYNNQVALKHITDYMCERISSQQNYSKIQAKNIPYNRFIHPQSTTKSYLQMPPSISGQPDQPTYKLSQKSMKTDSNKHSRTIIKTAFCKQNKNVFVLDSLSDHIAMYDQSCSLRKKISPALYGLKKQVVIVSFAYSQRQNRLGAVLKDFTLKFWDNSNNFQYQKSILTTTACQQLQTGIYFLQHFNSWATTSRTGTLTLWNLLQQKPQRKIQCKYGVNICALCQIAPLNLLAVVQECKRSRRKQTQQHSNQSGEQEPPLYSDATVVVYNFYTGYIVTQIDLAGQRIPHTILYSQSYRCLFMCGLQKKIRMYQIHPQYMDVTSRGELVGHQNLITSFTLLGDTPILASADDKGKLKLWDYSTRTCLQTIDFSDRTLITNVLDMLSVGQLGMFGSRVNYLQFQQRTQLIKRRGKNNTSKIQWIDFDYTKRQGYLYCNKMVKVLNLDDGQIKKIFAFRQQGGEEFNLFRYFSAVGKFVLANTRGQICIFNGSTAKLQSTLKQRHQGSICMLQFDQLNKIFVSVGYDSKILIHRSSDGGFLRQLRNNFQGRQINCMQLSVYHNLLVIGSNSSNSVYCWNYQYGKLIAEIRLEQQHPTNIQIVNGFAVMLITTNRGNIYCIAMSINSSDIGFSLMRMLQTKSEVLNTQHLLRLNGKDRHTQCQECVVLACCQDGKVMQFDLSQSVKKMMFRTHCKEKSNYNPYRQGKQNFITELQKIKDICFHLSPQNINKNNTQPYTLYSGLRSISLFRVVRLGCPLKVMIGNQSRLKIWNQTGSLLCDLNTNHCLPYRWQLRIDQQPRLIQKVYYGIKILQSIVSKFSSEISIAQAKNLQIRQLFRHLQKTSQTSYNQIKMMTQPSEPSPPKPQVLLLQNEFTRQDLNFQLVKKYNFTEIGGPTLKELDNVKKTNKLQGEWRIKEQNQNWQRQQLLKNIEMKAKKNQDQDHLQATLLKPKYAFQRDPQEDGQLVMRIKKHMYRIEHKITFSQQKKTQNLLMKTTNRFLLKGEAENNPNANAKPEMKRWLSRPKLGKTFQDYYHSKMSDTSCQAGRTKACFRQILTQMSGRVKNMKKQRYRPVERGTT